MAYIDIATVKFKNMGLKQINSFLSLVLDDPDLEISSPDVFLKIRAKDKSHTDFGAELGTEREYEFRMSAYDENARMLGSATLDMEMVRSNFIKINALHKLLSEDNTYVVIEKHKEVSFDDIVAVFYLTARVKENVFNKTHLDEIFKEHYRLSKMPFEELVKYVNARYGSKSLMYGELPEEYYSSRDSIYYIDSATIDFLVNNNLLEPKSIIPKVNSSSAQPLSSEEKQFYKWFDESMQNERALSLKPDIDILERVFSQNEQRINVFKSIFKRQKDDSLEMEF